jgi:asparagine synthase (glutamine-hydrolysing)
MYRYLAAVCHSQAPEGMRASRALLEAIDSVPGGWSVAWQGRGVLAMHTSDRPHSGAAHVLAGDRGVVLGWLFDRNDGECSARVIPRLNERESAEIVDSAGGHLVNRYWGAYFALIHDRLGNSYHVLRAPAGNLPCYYTQHAELHIFFSHVQDCLHFLPASLRVNRKYLLRWLLVNRLITRDTGLTHVEEIAGGERMSIRGGSTSREFVWHPVEFARNQREDAPSVLAAELRHTTQRTIGAWASCFGSIVHRLSGGLDSSIVAGCLAHAPSRPQVRYLNSSILEDLPAERLSLPGIDARTAAKLRAIAGHGDERYFARLVAERWATPLLERRRDVAMDLRRLWGAPLMMAPAMYFTAIEFDDSELEIAQQYKVDAFFSGQAGDSVFLTTVQPFPAMDYAYLHGLSRGLWPHLRNTAQLSKESLWSVMAIAIRHGILRRRYKPPFSILDQPSLLSDEVLSAFTEDDFMGTWADVSLDLPPGKRDHLESLSSSAYCDFVFHSGAVTEHINPLNSQPIWELMLQIPTYTILAGGVSRALARTAFADILPAEIRRRQVKGSGSTFYQQVVHRNRDFLREILADGFLVREGYVERDKVIDCLRGDRLIQTLSGAQILSYLSAEIWLGQWRDIEQTPSRANLRHQALVS